MSTTELDAALSQAYEAGFVTDIETETLPPGLDEKVIEYISAKKNEPEFLRQWRLDAFRRWQTMKEPHWAHVRYEPIDYQGLIYYAAPKRRSETEIDPKLLETYEKLGVPVHERAALAGVAVDAVFDSVSVLTTFKDKLSEAGVIFCPISALFLRWLPTCWSSLLCALAVSTMLSATTIIINNFFIIVCVINSSTCFQGSCEPLFCCTTIVLTHIPTKGLTPTP